LFLDEPRISVRRQLAGAGGGRAPFDVAPKDRVHLLFVVSRPKDAGFIDPRADPQAVMDAIEAEAPGRVTWEFLRPATVEGLLRRLDDRKLPTVDILHFDGHGAYDWEGTLAERAKQAASAAGANHLLKDAVGSQAQQGYLLFEKADGTSAPIAAGMLADVLHRKKVGLTVLSACQSATVGGEDPMGSVAARLTHAGLPSVLAMTHSVLVDTARALFGHFYRDWRAARRSVPPSTTPAPNFTRNRSEARANGLKGGSRSRCRTGSCRPSISPGWIPGCSPKPPPNSQSPPPQAICRGCQSRGSTVVAGSFGKSSAGLSAAPGGSW
jgi:hypothetical protein